MGCSFRVNANGVQADAAWAETSGSDYSYDQVWDSEGRITAKGWMAVVAIPFRSLRFRLGQLAVGHRLWSGTIRATARPITGRRVAASVSGIPSQEGTLRVPNLEGVTRLTQRADQPLRPGPERTHSADGRPVHPGSSAPAAWKAQPGVRSRPSSRTPLWWMAQSIRISAMSSPISRSLRSTSVIRSTSQSCGPFSWRTPPTSPRPFSCCTRATSSVRDWGVRVTGKVDHTNFGLLAINDREPGQTVPQLDPLYKEKAEFYVGRVSQDLGKGSNVGLMYTDEEFGGRLEPDWRARTSRGGQTITGRCSAKGWRALRIRVKRTAKQRCFRPAIRLDLGFYLEADRSGHAFNLQSVSRDYSTGFQSQVGFIQTTDYYNNQHPLQLPVVSEAQPDPEASAWRRTTRSPSTMMATACTTTLRSIPSFSCRATLSLLPSLGRTQIRWVRRTATR